MRSSENSQPDVAQMKSTQLRSIQSLLVAVLHDYWLAKYVMHVIAIDWPRVRRDGGGDGHCMSAGASDRCKSASYVPFSFIVFW